MTASRVVHCPKCKSTVFWRSDTVTFQFIVEETGNITKQTIGVEQDVNYVCEKCGEEFWITEIERAAKQQKKEAVD